MKKITNQTKILLLIAVLLTGVYVVQAGRYAETAFIAVEPSARQESSEGITNGAASETEEESLRVWLLDSQETFTVLEDEAARQRLEESE